MYTIEKKNYLKLILIYIIFINKSCFDFFFLRNKHAIRYIFVPVLFFRVFFYSDNYFPNTKLSPLKKKKKNEQKKKCRW
jgi:hypothetical protein